MPSMPEELSYWNALFRRDDPWNYASEYEQTKYSHTLELVPARQARRALEIGCAEGMFTAMLADRVGHVLALDIADTALARARTRCARFTNVDFVQHDVGHGLPAGEFDLIVCSEVLYYLRDRTALEDMAKQIATSLAAGGHLLMTHANMVSDDPSQTGFDFNEIGAKFIGEVFMGESGLEFVRELRTELYRVQLFRRRQAVTASHATYAPREVICRPHAPVEHPLIKWGGCAVTAAEARHCWVSPKVPILMYHRIAPDGPAALAPYRVAPSLFERQLAYLQRHGYHGMSMDEYVKTWFTRSENALPGRPVVLTFDDAYEDFYEYAWPLLRKYGFRAAVFVPLKFVGGRAYWDQEFGEPARLMEREQIVELHSQGVEIGAHGYAHQRPWEMTRDEFTEDTVRARNDLENLLGAGVSGYCYPYAAARPEQQKIIAEHGFDYAVCGKGGSPPDRDNRHYIPRIEIFGTDTMDEFIDKLPRLERADARSRAAYEALHARRDRATYMGR